MGMMGTMKRLWLGRIGSERRSGSVFGCRGLAVWKSKLVGVVGSFRASYGWNSAARQRCNLERSPMTANWPLSMRWRNLNGTPMLKLASTREALTISGLFESKEEIDWCRAAEEAL